MITKGFWVALLLVTFMNWGCEGTSKPVRKLTKPVDQTAVELTKVREFKSQGETVAVVSPADEKQLKFTF